ncbi:MAG TPA: hypothetical protein VKY22_12690 [Bradyrhizobium sp.]|jgi:hypothetical protein|nr:hypothetical protein [Bradyrhizobium sp.]
MRKRSQSAPAPDGSRIKDQAGFATRQPGVESGRPRRFKSQ